MRICGQSGCDDASCWEASREVIGRDKSGWEGESDRAREKRGAAVQRKIPLETPAGERCCRVEKHEVDVGKRGNPNRRNGSNVVGRPPKAVTLLLGCFDDEGAAASLEMLLNLAPQKNALSGCKSAKQASLARGEAKG